MSKARIPTKPANTVDELILQFGSEEGLVEAFILHQLADDDYHVISPTWLTCCLLRRVLAKLEEVRGAVRGEVPFDTFPIMTAEPQVLDEIRQRLTRDEAAFLAGEKAAARERSVAAGRLTRATRRRKKSPRKPPRQQRRGSR